MTITLHREDCCGLNARLTDKRDGICVEDGTITIYLGPGQAFKLLTQLRECLLSVDCSDYFDLASEGEKELRGKVVLMQEENKK